MAKKEVDWDNIIESMNVQEFFSKVAVGGKLKYERNTKGNGVFSMHYGDQIGVDFELYGKRISKGSVSESIMEQLESGEEFDPNQYQFDMVGSVENPALKLRKAANRDLSTWSDLF
jgi:hypothetical protein